MFYAPVSEEVSELEKDIKGGKVEIAQKQAIVKNLPQFLKEVERLDVELKKALAELPDKKEIHQLLSRVSDRARDAGLEIRLFKPQAEHVRIFMRRFRSTLSVRHLPSGGYIL